MPAECALTEDAAPAAQAGFIAAGGGSLFVFHHPPPINRRRGASVMLCPPLGYEYMSAYRTLRILAERLAAVGFDVWRFDYDGTGNSSGGVDEPNRVDAWLHSIRTMITEGRRRSGSTAVALVGVGGGALLALRAAFESGGVERLVLWSPFVSGRAYSRELKALAALYQEDHAALDSEPGLNVAGYIVTEETLTRLEQWTLDEVTKAPAPHVLILDRDDRCADPRLGAHLERSGARVARIQPEGTAAMLDLPQFAKVPDGALDEIVEWFQPWLSPPSRIIGRRNTDPGLLTSGAHRERPVRFGAGNRLFGVLTSPRDEDEDRPSIILFTTGHEYHVGPHRLYVPLARYWAMHGHRVLRFDLGGIGDSAPPPGTPENIAYPPHMIDNARDAVAFMRTEAPHSRVIAGGLCSGGWLAFRAARDRLAVDAIIAVNPPMYLREPDRGHEWLTARDEVGRYQQSMRDPSKWLKALRGGASYATFARLSAKVLRRSVALRVRGVVGEALPGSLANDLVTIADRGINSLFVFSRGDEGLKYFQLHAAPAFRCARVRDLIQHRVVDGAGHTFRPRSAQSTLRQILIDFVRSQSD